MAKALTYELLDISKILMNQYMKKKMNEKRLTHLKKRKKKRKRRSLLFENGSIKSKATGQSRKDVIKTLKRTSKTN